MHITNHRHYTFKNICLSSYIDGAKNLCKVAESKRSCSVRIRHFLAGIILITPFANCIAQTLFIRNQKKSHQVKKAERNKPLIQKKRRIPRNTPIRPTTAKRPARKPLTSDSESSVSIHLPRKTFDLSAINTSITKAKRETPKTIHSSSGSENSLSIPPLSILNDHDPEISELITAKSFISSVEQNAYILHLLSNGHGITSSWKQYLQIQGVTNPRQLSIQSYTSVPPLELLEAVAFDLWQDSEKILKYWPPEFMRDCAIAYPQFALKCITTDLLWDCFKGCTDEIIDICRVNATAAWNLIQYRSENNYRPGTLLLIFKSAFKAIKEEANRQNLSQIQLEKLAVFLSNCTLPVKKEHFDLLEDICTSLEDNDQRAIFGGILNKWTSQGIC